MKKKKGEKKTPSHLPRKKVDRKVSKRKTMINMETIC
jgi:hypothetical protein